MTCRHGKFRSVTEIEKEVDGVKVMEQAAIEIGSFVSAVINFAILAFVIFIALKVASRWMKTAADDAPPSDEIVLLTEIRDSLKR